MSLLVHRKWAPKIKGLHLIGQQRKEVYPIGQIVQSSISKYFRLLYLSNI